MQFVMFLADVAVKGAFNYKVVGSSLMKKLCFFVEFFTFWQTRKIQVTKFTH